MIDFSSEKYSGSTGHTGTPGTSREIYSEDTEVTDSIAICVILRL